MTKIANQKKQNNLPSSQDIEKPVLEHLQEIRSRLLFYLIVLCISSGIAYYFHRQIIEFLVVPLDKKLYYTNPAGALQFGLQVSVFLGFIASLPFLLYQTVSFLEPLLPGKSRRFIDTLVYCSMILIFAGVMVAYFLIIPTTLQFLASFGMNNGIEAMITADQYFSFIILYLGGFAILFQLPIVMYLVSRFTSVTWRTFLHYQQYVLVGCLITAAILTPTQDIVNLLLFAAPVVMLFYGSIVMIYVQKKVSIARPSSRGGGT